MTVDSQKLSDTLTKIKYYFFREILCIKVTFSSDGLILKILSNHSLLKVKRTQQNVLQYKLSPNFLSTLKATICYLALCYHSLIVIIPQLPYSLSNKKIGSLFIFRAHQFY